MSLSQKQMCTDPHAVLESFFVPTDVVWAELLREEPEEALKTRADFDTRPLLKEEEGGGPKMRGIAVFAARGGSGSKIQVQFLSSGVV